MRKNGTIIIKLLLLLVSFGFGEVDDIIIFTDGNAVTGRILSVNPDSLFYRNSPDESLTGIDLDQIYYAYNDFGKIFHYSRSLLDRIDYLEKYSGTLVTVGGDTIEYHRVNFDRRMVMPMVYLTVYDSLEFQPVPLLEIDHLRMSRERFDVSVKHGCQCGVVLLLAMSGMKTLKYFKNEYPGGGLFGEPGFNAMGEAVVQSLNDYLPEADFLGTKETGSMFRTSTLILPVLTMGWIGYDWYFDKRTVYINPGTINKPFPREMFLFSPVEWSDRKFRKIWEPLSRKALDKIYEIRKKIWKG